MTRGGHHLLWSIRGENDDITILAPSRRSDAGDPPASVPSERHRLLHVDRLGPTSYRPPPSPRGPSSASDPTERENGRGPGPNLPPRLPHGALEMLSRRSLLAAHVLICRGGDGGGTREDGGARGDVSASLYYFRRGISAPDRHVGFCLGFAAAITLLLPPRHRPSDLPFFYPDLLRRVAIKVSSASASFLLDASSRLSAPGASPCGFKLNAALAHHLGQESAALLALLGRIPSSPSAPLRLLVALSGLTGLGLSGSLALLFDLLRLSAGGAAALAWSLRLMHAAELQAAHELVHLFRGRKVNALRGGRVDTLVSPSADPEGAGGAPPDVSQLLLGTVSAGVVVFMFTTVAAYYAHFVMVHVAGCAACGAVWITYMVLLRAPMEKMARRRTDPRRMVVDLYFVHRRKGEDGGEEDGSMKVITLLQSPFSILAEVYAPFLRSFLSALSSLPAQIFMGQSISLLDDMLKITWMHGWCRQQQ